eukprot:5275566-Pyramimonas_sp.AAC.1
MGGAETEEGDSERIGEKRCAAYSEQEPDTRVRNSKVTTHIQLLQAQWRIQEHPSSHCTCCCTA